MDTKEALDILRINNFKNIDDIEYQYNKELNKATNAYNNAFNEIIKKEYALRIEELNAAFQYVSSNKSDLNHKALAQPLSFNISPVQKKLLILLGIALIVLSTFFGVRSFRANKYFEEGLSLYRIQDYESALPLFKRAEDLGSLKGKYYYGKTLHRYYPHQRRFGFETMKTAVDKGVELDDMERSEFNLLNSKKDNYNSL